MILGNVLRNTFLPAIITFSLVFLCGNVVAQEITAINFNGLPLGKVIPDGKVVGFDNKLVGNVTADSLIVDNKGSLIGGVVPQGVAIGNDTHLLGKVGSDGLVRSSSGQIVGKILPNGLVVNEYFDILGQVVFPGLVYDDNGKIAGRITGDGLYTNLSGQSLGVVTPDGYAYRKIGNDYILDGRLISSKMVVSLNGDFIGSVVPGGQVTDFNSQIIGRIKANGFVYNDAGNVIGRSVTSGYAFDVNGYYLGFVSYNGEVVNNNKVIGKLRADGRIVNVNGNIVGKIVDFSATSTDFNGRYLGRLSPDGAIFKSSSSNGLVGANGLIHNSSGLPIGALITTGPVFDYKGDVKGHAISNGSVISINGTTIGYMIKNKAYNLSGVIIGSTLSPMSIYSSDNTFLGISGISSSLDSDSNKFAISPLGYVFDQSGAIVGHALPLNIFYTPFGTISSYQGLDGQAVNSKGVVSGRIVNRGYILNSQNQLIAKTNQDFIAVNSAGESIGYVNDENVILNKSLNPIAKILPDGSVTEIRSGNLNYMPKIGQSYSGNIALDFNGNFLGYVDTLGNVNNLSVAKVGKVLERYLTSDNTGIVNGHVVDYASAINSRCELLGVMSDSGAIYNYRGVYAGKVLANGNVISDSGAVLGHIVSNTPIIDFNGRIIGFSTYEGKVINDRNEFIGCLNNKGELRNIDNALIGKSVEYEPIINFNGEIIGYSIMNGLVVDKNNELIGYQQPNDNINSNAGLPIGGLFKYKVAFNFDNKFIGYISQKGDVISSENSIIGKVNFDGYVINDEEKIGYALYDFYVYNDVGDVIGIINRNGDVASFTNQNLGVLDKGFVLKNKEIVARGNRDFNIRDNSKLVIGRLKLKGDVIDNLNNIVGKLSSGGEIIDANGSKLAIATPLQFYIFEDKTKDSQKILSEKVDGEDIYGQDGKKIGIVDKDGNVLDANGNIIGKLNENGEVVDATGNVIGSKNRNWFDKDSIVTTTSEYPKIEKDEDVSPALKLLEDSKYYKSLGIALTPDGEYLGDILEDDTVVDADGNIVGYKMPDGLIIDDDGELIGIEELADIDTSEKGEEKGLFVPAGSFGPGGAYGVGSGNAGNLGPGGGFGPGERYDPTRQAALNAAMQERRQNISVGKISSGVRKEAFDGYQKDWSEQGIPKSISSWRVDMSEMIFSDKPIPAVIARAIDTNNPAPVTAYVERNVYAEEGRNIIIPAGSRLIGAFGSITAAAEATSESARVQISWERLIRPDGSIFVFSGQTADAQGRAGALGYVDQQLFKKYTLPVVTTVLTSAASYFIASADDAAGEVETSKQQAANDARQNFLSDMESLFDEILSDKTDVKAMTYIPAGTRIIIYPNTDLWLRTAERDTEESQKYKKPEILIDDVKTEQDKEQRMRDDVAKASGSSVVYDPEDVDVEAADATSRPLIVDTAPKKSANKIAPPPPPSGGILPTTGTTSAITTTTTGSDTNNNSIPALF